MIRVSLLCAVLCFTALCVSGQEKARMRQKFQSLININFDSLGKLHAQEYAHVFSIDGNVVPLLYTQKFPVTIKSALRKDTPFNEIKFIEFIRTNETPHDTLWHSWTKLWTKHYEDSVHAPKVKRIEVSEALSSYIGIHKLNGKPVNVIAKNLANPQTLKKFINTSKIKQDEMVVIYYETEHGFYLGYKRL
jgi:hypothetical protein